MQQKDMTALSEGSIDRSFEEQVYDFAAESEKVAAARGCRVVVPAGNQLQVDLDSEEARREFWRRYDSFQWAENVATHENPSSTPGHYHVTVTFMDRPTPMSEWERLAWQAALGDDSLRHFLNVMRKYHGVETPTRLFEKLEP